MSQPLAVTVCVLTFNHEQYIRTALDSILKQKTDFRFEILVHDDCSTDRTQEIIIEYQKRYPDRIRTIFQSENQYSKGENFFDRAVYIHARGKYIALNEGDDFWLSESKLQTQYDFMEAHPDYSLCCHAALQANLSDELSDYRYDPGISPALEFCDLDLKTVVQRGSSVPTNSYFFRRKYALNGFPDFYRMTRAGDYSMILYFYHMGRIRFINQALSAYRYNAVGSWSRLTLIDPQKRIESNESLIRMLTAYDQYTEQAYQTEIKNKILDLEFENIILSLNPERAKQSPYLERYRALATKDRLKFRLKAALKPLYRIWLNFKFRK